MNETEYYINNEDSIILDGLDGNIKNIDNKFLVKYGKDNDETNKLYNIIKKSEILIPHTH
jgi:hypothetical protein